MKHPTHKTLFSLLVCAAALIALLAGCAAPAAAAPDAAATGTSASPGEPSGNPEDGGEALPHAETYDDVYAAVDALRLSWAKNGIAMESMVLRSEFGAAPSAAADTGSTAIAGSDTDYSGTNVQVEGIDEGDIVKTDGEYIYVLRENELIIFRADGASTAKLSSVKVAEGSRETSGTPRDGSSEPDSARYINEYASDIYVSGGTAVVVTSYHSYSPMPLPAPVDDGALWDGPIYRHAGKQVTKAYLYDIADRARPALRAELGQDGYLLTGRLLGSTLYLVSSHTIEQPVEGDAETYIPAVYKGGVSTLIAPDRIAVLPEIRLASHTVVCAYDLDTATAADSRSLLGGGSTVYMNADTLYLANSVSVQSSGEPYADSVYTVTERATENFTDIASFHISGGALTPGASGRVPGSLNSQFNMDAYDGNLRVVTTSYSQSWKEYADKARNFTNYIWEEPETANALFVLDGGLRELGRIDDLAPGEQVYAVRYDGKIGYIVTFRQVDPLFAIDLSDPARPTVLSALKIPGFSEYLHVYSQDRLFGLGMDADEETGRTKGMKLTMFDTADPADVSVKHELKLQTDYSVALYNHKAILISPGKDIIAFPAGTGYDIYGYSDGQGFFKRATVDAGQWHGDSRGLYIGDFAYIVDGAAITVLDMGGLAAVTRIAY